jgi:hypothetical protein
VKFAHIINPVNAPANSELGIVQPITLESIRVAINFTENNPEVALYAVCYPEDRVMVPDYIKNLPPLQRSVQDVAKLSGNKKYPLITDVLNAVYEADNADYLIYTNMDIALMPGFYKALAQLIIEGNYDAMLVNRRGISAKYKSAEQLPLMYADMGSPHPGFDCFIFKRDLLPKLQLTNICLGVSFSEVALVHNFIAFAKNLKLIDDMHLTFHIGKEVMPPLAAEYYNHNRKVYEQQIYPVIKHLLVLDKFPYSELPLAKRMLKWMLNPSFRTHQLAELEGKSLLRRLKFRVDSIRFSVMDKLR